MKRRSFIGLLGGMAAFPATARAQQKLPLVGFMGVGPTTGPDIRHGLSDNGFVEGRNFLSDYRPAVFEPTKMADHAVALAQRGAAVIVAITQREAVAAKAATQSIPIVFQSTDDDPVANGLVESLLLPGRNLTGVWTLNTSLPAKRLDILLALVPRARCVAYLMNPSNRNGNEAQTKALQAAINIRDVRVLSLNAGRYEEIEGEFQTLAREHADALIVDGDALFFGNRSYVATLAATYKIPTIYPSRDYVKLGGLVTLGTRFEDGWYTMGVYASRILRGEKPSELPVQQVTKTELGINLKTANMLGITIPPTLLASADEVARQ